MKRLTAMTLGAALIGLGGFVYDSASAQGPELCPKHEATVYFHQDSSVLNAHQNFAVDTMAAAAHTCRAETVLVQGVGNIERARAVATALKQRGVKTTVVALPSLGFTGDTMTARSVTLRVAADATSSS